MPRNKSKKNGRFYKMRRQRAAEYQARYNAENLSMDEDMDCPPPQQLNSMYKNNLPATIAITENTATVSVVSDNDLPDDSENAKFLLSEAEIDEEFMREHSEYEHNAQIKINLSNELRQWALQNKITLAALSQLLKLLNQVGIENLPLDVRTVLKTPRTTEIVDMGSGKFWYDGILRNLIHSL